MENNDPVLISCKQLKSEFNDLQRIQITSGDFSIGRSLKNSVVIPFLSISRSHCAFKKHEDNNWVLEDYSTFGIKINGNHLGKGSSKMLLEGDIITLEQTEEFIYKFSKPDNDFETPRKRRKLENEKDNIILDDVRLKFEESQNYEIKHIQEKIHNAKQMQTTSIILKEKLESDMNRKIKQLESEFASQIENLKGEKNEVERQKMLLLEERDCQLAAVKIEMEEKIVELMDQIQRHNETESELLKENSLLKEKLMKEREEFLSELSRENSSKQDMLEKLEAKIKEQEEVRLKEKQEYEEMLRRETEQLRIAKEKELKELEEQKKQRELELKQQLDEIQKNLQDQVAQTEQQRLKAEQVLIEQMEQMKKLSDEEKVKMEQLVKEREEIEKKLNEAQINASKSLEELRTRVTERETELAALAADKIQKQAEQSSEVINTLQKQLEKVKNQLQTVETEKNTILENLAPELIGESSSKQNVLTEVGELMESELQCSICAELFVSATTLNCSHTFCKYCITMWKKKKKDCPICRSPITSECKSLVLDSFIEKMVQNLSEEMKLKRQDILKGREELESELARGTTAETRGRSHSYDESDAYSEFLEEEEGEEEYDDEYYGNYSWDYGNFRRRYYDTDSDCRYDESDEEPDYQPADATSTTLSNTDANSRSDDVSVDVSSSSQSSDGATSSNSSDTDTNSRSDDVSDDVSSSSQPSEGATGSNSSNSATSDSASDTDASISAAACCPIGTATATATNGSHTTKERTALVVTNVEGATSRAIPTRTTAATGAATAAARAATGHRAAPSNVAPAHPTASSNIRVAPPDASSNTSTTDPTGHTVVSGHPGPNVTMGHSIVTPDMSTAQTTDHSYASTGNLVFASSVSSGISNANLDTTTDPLLVPSIPVPSETSTPNVPP